MLISFDQKEYEKLDDNSYRLEKRRLQIELLKLQEDVIKNNRKVCIVFEGRDTAGKSSASKFFTQYLIPKNFSYVNLGIPSEWESSHWFERWEKVIPKAKEISFLDRSWYTRALTEPVMGYCSERQYRDFMQEVLSWELKLQKDGVELIKFYFSITKDQQKKRMKARKRSKLKYWKTSENDEQMVSKWDAFTLYKEQMFEKTAVSFSPWVVINANNKMIARLTALRFLLNQMNYDYKKLLKPVTWTKNVDYYNVTIEGVRFTRLSYEQYKVLSRYSDDD